MLAFSDIIDFLLRLVRDDDARTQFERDPQGTLARAGLDGVTGQDIRDARLALADSGAMCAVDDGRHAAYPGGHDPVHEIGYTTAHYAAQEHVRNDSGHHAAGVDHASAASTTNANTFLTIDDRDTLFFSSIEDNDVTVTDNSVSVADSFNQDNSQVTAIQANNSSGAFSSDDDVVAIQDNDVNGGGGPIAVDTSAADPTRTEAAAPPDADTRVDLPDPVAVDDPPEDAAPEVDTPDDTPDDSADDAAPHDADDAAVEDSTPEDAATDVVPA